MAQGFSSSQIISPVPSVFIVLLLFNTALLPCLSGYILDERYLESVSKQDVGRVKVDTMCSEASNLCFSVVDLINEKDDKVRRAIYLHGFEKEFDTLVTLTPPKGMSAKNSDTRMWSVDHLVVNTVYVCSLIISPFMVGALNTDFLKSSSSERPDESMLIVGLGGGALDMFIHTKFPSVQINVFELDSIVKTLANKWFDVLKTEIIQDGIAAIKKASGRGEKYNVVVIDACDSTTQMPCPTAGFIQLEVLRTIKLILKPQGVIVVNVLALQDELNNLKMVERRLLSVFPVCTSISIETEFNSIYACLPEDIHPDRLHPTAQIWTQRRKELQNAFGFAQEMHDIDFKYSGIPNRLNLLLDCL
uniref:Spermine synthase n=1 Tax=Ditylenchus dipsaci TaxID=166011 RepID=A0A915DAK2_9BILA